MIHHFNADHRQEYTIVNAAQIVHLYENTEHECMEIDLTFTVSKDRRLEFTPIIMGTSSYKITLTLILEENAQALIKGAYALTNAQKCMINTRQYHLGKNSTSNLSINGVVTDNAFADYRGMIRIEQTAPGTCAHQENKTMLFSDTARATSIPSIEVLNHEVSCAHGSAVGPLDKEQIMYACARGIQQVDAKKMIVRSFFGQMLDKIDKPEKKEQLVNQLTNRIIGE